MVTPGSDRLPFILGGGVAAVALGLGVAALLLGPGHPSAGRTREPPRQLSIPLAAVSSKGPGGVRAGGSAAPVSGSADTVVVTLANSLEFVPASIEIRAGQTVLWKNTSDLIHTSTDDSAREAIQGDAVLPRGAKSWDSGRLKPGQSFSHTFTVSGTYHYFCEPHEPAGMKGVVRVRASSR